MKRIKDLIDTGKVDQAIALLDAYIDRYPDSDEAFFLRGNAYSKKSDFRQALINYLDAMALNPDSPARQAHDMLMKIMAFYDKNRYNQ